MTTYGKIRGDCSRRLIALSPLLRRGFTYAESMIAMAVMSLAGAALLTSVAGAVQSSNDSIYRSVGQGLAEQLMDEIAASKFPTATASLPNPIPLRSWFTTIDDYAMFSECPPRTKAGEVLGNDDAATASMAYMDMLLGKAGSRTSELAAAPSFVGRFTRSVLVELTWPASPCLHAAIPRTSKRRSSCSRAMPSLCVPARRCRSNNGVAASRCAAR